MNDIQAAQVAMFWDSEGTIGIWAQKRSRRPRSIYFKVGFQAANTNLVLLESIRKDIGCGSVSPSKPKGNAKVAYKLTVSQREAEPVIRRILPFLRAKNKQAELALEFLKLQRNAGRGGIVEGIWQAQKELHLQCGPLNQRGTVPFESKVSQVQFDNVRDYNYLPYVRRKFKPARYCSVDECGQKHYAKNYCLKHYLQAFPKKVKPRTPVGARGKKPCVFCGNEFEYYRKTPRYCSITCRALAYNHRRNEIRKLNPSFSRTDS